MALTRLLAVAAAVGLSMTVAVGAEPLPSLDPVVPECRGVVAVDCYTCEPSPGDDGDDYCPPESQAEQCSVWVIDRCQCRWGELFPTCIILNADGRAA